MSVKTLLMCAAALAATVLSAAPLSGEADFRNLMLSAWTNAAHGVRTQPRADAAAGERPAVRLGRPFVRSSLEAMADYLSSGTRRTLVRSATHEVVEFAKDGRILIVAMNLSDEPLKLRLPGYEGVYHEFRGPRTFSFSPFATQLDLASTLAPRETVLMTSDNRQDGSVPTAELLARIDREENARILKEDPRHGEYASLRGTGAPRLAFGVLADLHLSAGDSRGIARFRSALRYFDTRKADAVVIAGDITQNGTVSELRLAGALWDEAFPNDRRSDGGHVEKLFVYGDHEVERFTSGSPGVLLHYNNHPSELAAARREDIALNDRAKQWRAAFHEAFAPIVRKTVKGYDFVLAHLTNDSAVPGLRYAEPLYIPGLEEFFGTNRFDRTRPLFYVQHKIPKGTVGGPTMYGQDAGRTSAILKDYPNAVAFCGHKHRSARDERMLWQGAFTAVEVPGCNSAQTEAGYENGWTSADRPTSLIPRQMPHIDFSRVAQGLFATVYDDRIVFERREFTCGGEIDEPWIVPVPNDGSAAYAKRAARAAQRPLPRFPDGAAVTAREVEGLDRDGKATPQIEVVTRTAPTRGEAPRTYAYEFRAVVTKDFVTRIALAKRVFAPEAGLAECFDRGWVRCVFAKGEIPSDHDTVVFEVRPIDAFGRVGEPVRSAPRSFNPEAPCLYPF